MKALSEDLRKWLDGFAHAVRARDFKAGAEYFSPDVVSFGTVCGRAETLEELCERQWGVVWPRTAGFDFDHAAAREIVSGNQAVIVAGWRSTGYTPDKKAFSRQGRATIVLQKSEGRWLAVHTHFSHDPAVKNDQLFCSL